MPCGASNLQNVKHSHKYSCNTFRSALIHKLSLTQALLTFQIALDILSVSIKIEHTKFGLSGGRHDEPIISREHRDR